MACAGCRRGGEACYVTFWQGRGVQGRRVRRCHSCCEVRSQRWLWRGDSDTMEPDKGCSPRPARAERAGLTVCQAFDQGRLVPRTPPQLAPEPRRARRHYGLAGAQGQYTWDSWRHGEEAKGIRSRRGAAAAERELGWRREGLEEVGEWRDGMRSKGGGGVPGEGRGQGRSRQVTVGHAPTPAW
ncbi:hypothetical protein E2C01_091704 [Portunus trituberculatus]|uniref:Uncharacterized protein n=1 Tax=Portunus trituberculatus TaxID=210409 RepID=A0A5B7JVS5_PORTR|nr:hypothetical protein [Portunus trituberculatus]